MNSFKFIELQNICSRNKHRLDPDFRCKGKGVTKKYLYDQLERAGIVVDDRVIERGVISPGGPSPKKKSPRALPKKRSPLKRSPKKKSPRALPAKPRYGHVDIDIPTDERMSRSSCIAQTKKKINEIAKDHDISLSRRSPKRGQKTKQELCEEFDEKVQDRPEIKEISKKRSEFEVSITGWDRHSYVPFIDAFERLYDNFIIQKRELKKVKGKFETRFRMKNEIYDDLKFN